ncbi:protein ASPARTIC PROTEASE IN GUARD CELL 1-like [Salvia miltiorrhiza]|uniref:protein ASPARTIC PROTEASE IN GUARD CELL 1-like n=1 Tax=Salvia miltiorrhiza TaxID=226208 RepID=UPI0025ACDFDB|nr:protein ASPARTIC PROTEASE IN GUARD CELL 1-like [Salvia miltiorrhiza]
MAERGGSAAVLMRGGVGRRSPWQMDLSADVVSGYRKDAKITSPTRRRSAERDGRGSRTVAGAARSQVLYGDASHTIGNFATVTISFGSSGTVDNVAIGCGHDNGGLFFGAAGLLGLGGGASSLPAQIKATSFSYCLVDRDSNSSSTLDFNSIPPADSVAAPLVDNPSNDAYRYVPMTGISVGGEAVKFAASLLEMGSDGSGGMIVDSGTTVTRLRRDVYGLVRDAFRNKTSALPWVGDYALFDTCYDLPSLSKARIPMVAGRGWCCRRRTAW